MNPPLRTSSTGERTKASLSAAGTAGAGSEANRAVVAPLRGLRSMLPEAEKLIGVLSLIIHVVTLIFAVVEILPHFLPEATVIWSTSIESAPGFQTVVFNFKNPSSSTPLEQFEAEWRVDQPTVILAVSQLPEPYVVRSLLNPEHILHLGINGDFPADASFKAYLHADQPFQVVSQEFKASIPTIGRMRSYSFPADVMSQDEWDRATGRARWKAGGVIMLVLAVLLGLNWLSSTVRSVVRRQETA